MRELAVRIKFLRHSLGNVKLRDGSGRFAFARNAQGLVTFLPSWHRANLVFSSQLVSLHQDEVGKILWDTAVEGLPGRDAWYRRYYRTDSGRSRYALHEAFVPGQLVCLNCAVPPAISADDLWRLLEAAGRYKGLSPYKPGEYGLFEVESIRLRRNPIVTEGP